MDYAGLKSAIKSWIADDYTDFDGVIDEIVINVEKRISREANLPDQFTWKTDGTLTQGTNTLSLPSGATGVVHWLTITLSTGKQAFLEKRTTSFIRDYAPDPTTTGQPKYYATYGDASLLLGPTPNYQTGSTDYPYTLLHEVRITGLPTAAPNDGTQTNWLSVNAEDALLYGCLIEGDFVHKNPEMMAAHEKRYEGAIASLNNEVARIHRDATNTHG